MNKILLTIVGSTALVWSAFNTMHSGVIKDLDTQLEWQNGSKIVELDWDNAVSYCTNLNLNGRSWRLPSKSELVSIVKRDENAKSIRDYTTNKSALEPLFLDRNININYWTSTTDKDEANLAWGINFKNGWSGRYSKKFYLKVRCVRGKLTDNRPDVEILGVIKESKPFSDEKEGVITISGEPNPIMVKPNNH